MHIKPILGLLLALTQISIACNEAKCKNIVSYCQLIGSCSCEMPPKAGEPCKCCRNCTLCLDQGVLGDFAECCSCVGLCPARNATQLAQVDSESVVYDFENPVPTLWSSFTEEEDPKKRWESYSFEVDLSSAQGFRERTQKPKNLQEIEPLDTVPNSSNCTVAYMNQCTSKQKCWELLPIYGGYISKMVY